VLEGDPVSDISVLATLEQLKHDCTTHLDAAQALVDRGVTLLAQCP
jgi:hypothetical protein